jgi:predicted nucleotidyltransferase
MFGSSARGDERRDLDLLIVLRGIPKSLERRYQVYKPIHDVTMQTGRVIDITVIDLDEESFRKKDTEVTPFHAQCCIERYRTLR